MLATALGAFAAIKSGSSMVNPIGSISGWGILMIAAIAAMATMDITKLSSRGKGFVLEKTGLTPVKKAQQKPKKAEKREKEKETEPVDKNPRNPEIETKGVPTAQPF